MKKLNTYKENYLLWIALIGFSIFSIVYFILSKSDTFQQNPTRLDGLTNFKVFVITALLFAPIIEEVLFRGYFSKRKLLKYISIIGLPLFALTIGFYYFILTIGYVIILSLALRDKGLKNVKIIYFINGVLFALAHYTLQDFSNIVSITPIIAHFSIGLFLVWVVINFKLRTSIIAHFILNFLVILPFFATLQYPDDTKHSLALEGYTISWYKTPILNNSTFINLTQKDEVNAKNITPIELYKIYTTNKNLTVKDSEIFSKYVISITNNSTPKNLDEVIVKKLLLKANLITEIK